MATRQIVVSPGEYQVLLMAALNGAVNCLSTYDLDGVEHALKRAGELNLALKEFVASLPKTNSSTEGKRA